MGGRTTRSPWLATLASLGLVACPGPPSSVDGGSSGTTGTTLGTATEATTAEGGTSSSSGLDGTTGAGSLPPAPTLVSPIDGAVDVPVQTELCWTLVDDPDGDAVRYRVFVDDIELGEGIQGEQPGWEGPCLGPLDFAHEQTFAWWVQAFEVDDPQRVSEPSPTWSFTTVYDGISSTVFEDDFEEDRGWEVSGDALTGAWVRGDPVPASHLGAPSQPGRCAGGSACVFTGQNAAGQADDEDVSGGRTVLTSPPFDLGGAAAATVRLRRFFYESSDQPGPSLRVDLLVPDARVPGGYVAHALEQLDQPTTSTPHNRWTPREYGACSIPMVDGSRLRLTATDVGTGILEAAVDSVSVHAHDDASVCGSGEGGLCDPTQGATACPGELLCCPQGSIHRGIHRCAPAVAGLDFDDPPAAPEDPGNGAVGCDAPDLVIDESWIEPVLTDIFVHEGTCELYEGCVGGLGWRTILRFTLTASNIGSRDLVLGVAANEPDVFHYSECHDHHHFDEFATFELRDEFGVVASGFKPGFCLLDSYSWAWPNTPGHYDCANQGISRGYADIYESDLPCQWIDVTDVPPGDYTIRAALNQARADSAVPVLVERDYDNNVVEVPVTLPLP
ncbi:lysyl oxidase family protein [Paraliomyxa miuraensis]|uniref:lysyl oxidase family protein n=1 Tax=Paraliomyxa miuraensis TaxID=376150 RepID=UPI0022551F81|nr:lysyl oxidase family protein [Paraliomyxa miuraensis]MCX4247864.1 lysyl oxidase family protein [Paraliomyxa miuraensis]